MRSKSQILKSYEYMFVFPSISHKNILEVVKHMQGKYSYDDNDLLENQNFIKQFCYRESCFPASKDIEESESLLAKYKTRIFLKKGSLRKSFYNCNIKDRSDLIFYADKIEFLGFMKVLTYCSTAKGKFQKLSVYPVLRFVGPRGTVTFQESCLYRSKKYLQVLSYNKYTPQQVVCKGCQYLFGQVIYGVLFNCAPCPDGPDGYSSCNHWTLQE